MLIKQKIIPVTVFLVLSLTLCACSPPQTDIETIPPPISNEKPPEEKPLENAPPEYERLPPNDVIDEITPDGSLHYSSRIPKNADIYPDGEGPVVLILKEGTLRPDRAVFVARNTGDTDISLWRYQPEIQVKIDGEWKTPPSYGGGGGVDSGLLLKAGEEMELLTDWHLRYGDLSPGTYRFIKDFDLQPKETYYASCTFVIEAQDRSDQKFQGYPWPIGLEDEGVMSDKVPVSLSVVPETLTPGFAQFVLENKTDSQIRCDITYSIQIKIEDKWYRIEWRKVGDKIKEPPPGWELLKPIPPKSSVTLSHDWEHAYGKLPSGTYRIMRRTYRGSNEGVPFDLYSEPFTIE